MLWVPRAFQGTQADSATGRRRKASGCRRARRVLTHSAIAFAATAALTQNLRADTITWNDDLNGLWHHTNHWSPSVVPGPLDDVVIDRPLANVEVTIDQGDRVINSLYSTEHLIIGGGTLAVAAASQTYAFTLSSGELRGAGDFTIANTGVWSNGTKMSGSGRTIVSASANLLINTDGTYHKRLERTLENYGTITFNRDGIYSLTFNGGTLNNRAGATFIVNETYNVGTPPQTFYGDTAGANTFLNEGTFNKTGPATTIFGGGQGVAFLNNGLVNVQEGVLKLQTGATHTGNFTVALIGNLRLEGSHTLTSASHITGAGGVGFYSGTSTVDGAIDLANSGVLTISGANATFNGTVHAGMLSVVGGSTVVFNNSASFTNASLTGVASFSGSGQVTLEGNPGWTGGGIMSGSGKTVVTNGAMLTLSSSTAAKTIQRTIENRGTINWNGSSAAASLNFAGGAIDNLAGATFNINGDLYSLIGVGGSNVFNNAGTLNKSGTGSASFTGTGTSIVTLNNTGALNMSAGTLSFDSALLNSGTVSLSGGTMTLAAGLTNGGMINVTGGVLNVGGTNTTAQWGSWTNAGGDINVLGTLDNSAAMLALSSTTGSLRMQAGSRIVGGTLSTTGGAKLHVIGAATLDGLTMAPGTTVRLETTATVVNGLTLAGGIVNIESDVPATLLFSGSQTIAGSGQLVPTGSVGASLTIAASAGNTLTLSANTLVRPGDHDLFIGLADSAVVNQGTMSASVAARTLSVVGTSINNQGTFEASNGGTLFVGSNLANLSAQTLTGGRWLVSDNSTLRIGGANIVANATILTLDGVNANFYMDGSGTVSALANLANNAPTGDLSILGGKAFATISNFSNAGKLTVGTASSWTTPGTFTNTGTVIAGGSINTTSTINDGVITQNGGTHTTSGDLVVGNALSGAKWDLNAGGLNVGGFATVGSGTASASFNQNDGAVSVAKQLYVAAAGANVSSYNLAGGSLVVPELLVGFFSGAQGTFNQSGGSVTLTGGTSSSTTAPLTIGYSSLATTKGVYNLSGGTLADNGVNVGFGAGNSAFVQTGGTHTISGTLGLKLAMFSGGNGSYSLGPVGALTVAADEQIGVSGAGTFNQTGGTHNVAGAITLGANALSSGTFNLSGGTLTAGSVNLLRGKFNQTGGTLNAANFLHSGGEAAGTLQNQGTYTYNSGLFSGRLLNSGTVVLNANLTLGDGLDNHAAITIGAGRTVAANGAGLANTATVTLSGGTLTASSTVNHGAYVQSAGAASLGNISGTGNATISGGSLAANHIRQDALSIQADALVTLAAGSGASVVKSLSIANAAGAALEVNNNSLIVDYTGDTVAGQIRALLLAGRGTVEPLWTGAGIRSAAAAANPSTALGYAEASAALGISGLETGTFAGQTVDATSILVKFTWLGDSNLDGMVTFADLVNVAQNYGVSGGQSWYQGDFNYDGDVNFADLVVLAQAYGTGAAPGAAADFGAEFDRALSTVPEPSTGAILALLGTAALLRRRRRA